MEILMSHHSGLRRIFCNAFVITCTGSARTHRSSSVCFAVSRGRYRKTVYIGSCRESSPFSRATRGALDKVTDLIYADTRFNDGKVRLYEHHSFLPRPPHTCGAQRRR